MHGTSARQTTRAHVLEEVTPDPSLRDSCELFKGSEVEIALRTEPALGVKSGDKRTRGCGRSWRPL